MSHLEIVTEADEYQEVFEQTLFTRPAVYIQGGEKAVGIAKGIVNELGDCIAVVGMNYNLVQNKDIMPKFHEVILASDLDKTGMTKEIQQSHYGAKTIVTYTFPAHQIEITDGDFVQLRIMVPNSYDGSWKFMSMVGAVRIACMNGQVVVDKFSSYNSKHTASLDTDVAVAKMETALEVYTQNAEIWKSYPKTTVTNLQATRIFKQVAGKSVNLEALLEETYLKYVNEMGKNLWAVFNTLTDWSSHAKFKNEDNKASTIVRRETKVRKVLPMLEDIRKAA